MNKTIQWMFSLALIVVCTGCGISANGLKGDPGYASFEYPAMWEAEKEISLSIGPAILGLGRMFIDEDEEFSELVKNVKGIHLRVYNIDDNQELIDNYVDESARHLNKDGWEQLVSSRDNGEHAVVMVKMKEQAIQGLVVLSLDHSEAVFINVIGNIQPESLQPLISEVYDDAPAITTTL